MAQFAINFTVLQKKLQFIYIKTTHKNNNIMRRNFSNVGTQIKCPHSDCGYSWHYNGNLLKYATCPSCRRNVRIQENKIELLKSGSPVSCSPKPTIATSAM